MRVGALAASEGPNPHHDSIVAAPTQSTLFVGQAQLFPLVYDIFK